jgi:predicted PhzF superfamily epimerase YddE/YHI9
VPRHHIGDQFKQVDAFTANTYLGNATALALDDEGPFDEAILRFAECTNLAVTAVMLPPTPQAIARADCELRTFTISFAI